MIKKYIFGNHSDIFPPLGNLLLVMILTSVEWIECADQVGIYSLTDVTIFLL